jgi:cytochrome c-type biogenesis protein CcmE
MKPLHIIGIIVIAIAIGLVVSTAGDASTYVSFSDAEALAKDGDSKAIHVVGSLKKDADGQIEGMKYDPRIDPNHFEFMMTDTNQVEKLVIYNSPKPQDLERSEKVVVIGHISGDHFNCEKILLKCPSKYNDNKTEFKEAKADV